MGETHSAIFPIEGTTAFAILEGTVTLIDAGVPEALRGPAGAVSAARALEPFFDFFASNNVALTDVQLIVPMHTEPHHLCALNDLVRVTGARVVAHKAAAPVIVGLERPTLAELSPGPLEAVRATPVARAVEEGDTLSFLGGAQVIGIADGSPGTIALYSRMAQALFVGDALRVAKDGRLRGSVEMDVPPGPVQRSRMVEFTRDVRRLLQYKVSGLYASHSIPEGGARAIEDEPEARVEEFLSRVSS